MTSFDELHAAMLAHYPADLPSWEDPHEGMDLPADEEYSRVTDGGRYRIVVERARAWTSACQELLGARVEEFPAEPGDAWQRGGWTITSPLPRTSPLVVRVFGDELDCIGIGCGAAQAMATFPDCGCDACDDGSDRLLTHIDDFFEDAVTGHLAHLWGEGWHATRHTSGHGSGGVTDAPVQLSFEEAGRVLDDVAAGRAVTLPEGIQAVRSGNWLA